MLKHASIEEHALQVVPIPEPRRGRGSRAKCKCCGKRTTHHLLANGICMGWNGCEVQVWRYKRALEKRRGFR